MLSDNEIDNKLSSLYAEYLKKPNNYIGDNLYSVILLYDLIIQLQMDGFSSFIYNNYPNKLEKYIKALDELKLYREKSILNDIVVKLRSAEKYNISKTWGDFLKNINVDLDSNHFYEILIKFDYYDYIRQKGIFTKFL